MKKCYMTLVPLFRRIISLSLSLGAMPEDLKIAILSPLLKKSNIDFESLTNSRPVSNFKFLSKLIEKSVSGQLSNYLIENDLHEHDQSAYKAFHSPE